VNKAVELPMSPDDLRLLAESLGYASIVQVTLTPDQASSYCSEIIARKAMK
jgi:hypothetical protein